MDYSGLKAALSDHSWVPRLSAREMAGVAWLMAIVLDEDEKIQIADALFRSGGIFRNCQFTKSEESELSEVKA